MEDCLTNTRYLAAYYFCYFAATGVSEPYLPPYWRSLGFSSADLGLLNAIAPAIAAVAPFLWTAAAALVAAGATVLYWAGTRAPAGLGQHTAARLSGGRPG